MLALIPGYNPIYADVDECHVARRDDVNARSDRAASRSAPGDGVAQSGRQPQRENTDRAADRNRRRAGQSPATVGRRVRNPQPAHRDAQTGKLLEMLGLADHLNKPIPPTLEQEA